MAAQKSPCSRLALHLTTATFIMLHSERPYSHHAPIKVEQEGINIFYLSLFFLVNSLGLKVLSKKKDLGISIIRPRIACQQKNLSTSRDNDPELRGVFPGSKPSPALHSGEKREKKAYDDQAMSKAPSHELAPLEETAPSLPLRFAIGNARESQEALPIMIEQERILAVSLRGH